ncbi:hypothetical protein BS78_03G078400 [Paspalum vaginatum]|nr:hypothetical protein BS78_03G078400 [Paspalum vaginatum]
MAPGVGSSLCGQLRVRDGLAAVPDCREGPSAAAAGEGASEGEGPTPNFAAAGERERPSFAATPPQRRGRAPSTWGRESCRESPARRRGGGDAEEGRQGAGLGRGGRGVPPAAREGCR